MPSPIAEVSPRRAGYSVVAACDGGDAWLCALHTESLEGDPFGRRAVDRPSGS